MGTAGSLPGFSERRELLFAQQPDAGALSARGRAFLEAGLLEPAIEFFTKAGDAAGTAQVAEAARRSGDAFALEAALKTLGKNATPQEWVAVGETALAAGLLWFAYRAFEKADNQGGLDRTRAQMASAGINPPAQGPAA